LPLPLAFFQESAALLEEVGAEVAALVLPSFFTYEVVSLPVVLSGWGALGLVG